MTYSALTVMPDAPSRLVDAATFEEQADAYLAALANLVTELNGTIAALNAGGLMSAILKTTFSMALTTLAANTTQVYDVTLTGVASTDTLVVTPVEWSTNTAHRARIVYHAYYVSADTVRVLVCNVDGSSATLTAGTWTVSALR